MHAGLLSVIWLNSHLPWGSLSTAGQLLMMAAAMVGGGTYKGLAPHLKPMVVGFGTELVDTVSAARLHHKQLPSHCVCVYLHPVCYQV